MTNLMSSWSTLAYNIKSKEEIAASVIKIHAACLKDGHLMNVLDHPQACGCSASKGDGLTCGTVARTTVQVLNVADHYTVEQYPGGCTALKAAPEINRSNKSRGPGDGCMPSGQHPIKNWLSRNGNTVILGLQEI